MFARNNCTYCGGGIEDNYPAAGADCVSPWYQQPRHHHHHHDNHHHDNHHHHHHNEGGHHHILSDCSGGLLLPNRHHRLLHVEGETMRQVQSKFLLKKSALEKKCNRSLSKKSRTYTKMHCTVTMNINTRLWRKNNASSAIESWEKTNKQINSNTCLLLGEATMCQIQKKFWNLSAPAYLIISSNGEVVEAIVVGMTGRCENCQNGHMLPTGQRYAPPIFIDWWLSGHPIIW